MSVPIAETVAAMLDRIRETGQTGCDHIVLCWLEGTHLRTLHTAVPPEVLAHIHYNLADAAADLAPPPGCMKH